MTARQDSLDRRDVPVEGDLRLPKPPGVIRQFWYRHPKLTDALVASAYLLPALAFGLLTAGSQQRVADGSLVPFGIAAVLLGGLALLFRRSRPWTVLVVAWVVTLLAAPSFGVVDIGLVPFALYALAVYGSVRAAWIGFGASVVVGAAGSQLADMAVTVEETDTTVGNSVSLAVVVLVVVLVGINIGNRRRYVVALLDRAAQLARERDQQARLAAAAERSRIAREMHDIVSHGLTVMVTLADGSAATAAAQPERAADAMRQVAETGRQALGDMRRMLGLLDDGTPGQSEARDLEPQPGVAEIGGLIEGFRTAGLAIRLSTEGDPPDDPAEQLTIYRLVQESLTNVLRHSSGATAVTVDVVYQSDAVTIEVTNDGLHSPEPGDSGGHGIVGMRERVALYGGTIESGPRPGGGWTVVATLAHDAPPAAPPAAETNAADPRAADTEAASSDTTEPTPRPEDPAP